MCSLLAAVADYCGASSVCGAPTLRFHAAAGATNGPNVVPYSWSWRLPLTLSQTYQLTIPFICHRHHRRCLCKKKLTSVNFYRFNAKNWQFTVYFAEITQKIGNLLCILS